MSTRLRFSLTTASRVFQQPANIGTILLRDRDPVFSVELICVHLRLSAVKNISGPTVWIPLRPSRPSCSKSESVIIRAIRGEKHDTVH